VLIYVSRIFRILLAEAEMAQYKWSDNGKHFFVEYRYLRYLTTSCSYVFMHQIPVYIFKIGVKWKNKMCFAVFEAFMGITFAWYSYLDI
jgi:hypothetical protein